ncbi:MAG: hypothetical protein AB7J35_19470 [Dehalococcoidia bacterium]
MKFPGKKHPDPAPERDRGFAAWLLRQFNGGRPMSEMPYAEVERVCSNAGSLLFGAAYASPEEFAGTVPVTEQLAGEAALLSRRTADGFKASLEDRKNAVIAWPWDHLATKAAWEASRANDTSEETLAATLTDIGATYAIRHRDQLTAVLDLWGQIASNVRNVEETLDLAKLGATMLIAYKATTAA